MEHGYIRPLKQKGKGVIPQKKKGKGVKLIKLKTNFLL